MKRKIKNNLYSVFYRCKFVIKINQFVIYIHVHKGTKFNSENNLFLSIIVCIIGNF